MLNNWAGTEPPVAETVQPLKSATALFTVIPDPALLPLIMIVQLTSFILVYRTVEPAAAPSAMVAVALAVFRSNVQPTNSNALLTPPTLANVIVADDELLVAPLRVTPYTYMDDAAAFATVNATFAAPTDSDAPANQASDPARFTEIIATRPAGGVHVIAAVAVKLWALSTFITSPSAAMARAPVMVCLASAQLAPESALSPSTELTNISAISQAPAAARMLVASVAAGVSFAVLKVVTCA